MHVHFFLVRFHTLQGHVTNCVFHYGTAILCSHVFSCNGTEFNIGLKISCNGTEFNIGLNSQRSNFIVLMFEKVSSLARFDSPSLCFGALA